MKIAVVSESPADETAIKILVDSIVQPETEFISLTARADGWTTVFELLRNVIPGLHYHQPDVEALVVVIDSDDSPTHQKEHELPHQDDPNCRLCLLKATVSSSLAKLRPLPNRTQLKTALGLAVPAIEAWYRSGLDPHVNENAWNRKLLSGENVGYDRRSLKRDVYGTDQPSLAVKESAAMIAARRLASNLESLEELFPNGFGSLLRDLRGWL